ncbi:FtsK/SpoIIIE family DNA translocase [Dichotomicrobium thermohalophilum]|uniref:DNA translocase FtsK n=1 Tax=Dichotomicrobium thermohalophilum TaxID=933063 RepID=A0A397QD10_9HYPH|nr:DNA translocase FtsK [Dichotomicrobium thermohalophilum]RIA55974.1 DNA translocase FtsK [Dichotomicrobium thermohalophilum]
MATYTVSRPSRRLLPASMEAAIARLFRRGLGVAVLSLALAGWASLLTWSVADPSLNHITEQPPENLLGAYGASVADLMIQSLGLAAVTVFLPVAALGFRLAAEYPAGPLRLMSLLWLVSTALIAMSLSPLPAPETWPLAHGLGGIIGDFLMVGGVHALGFVPDHFAQAVAGAVAGLAGGVALMAACGLSPRDMAVLLDSERTARAATRSGTGIGEVLRGLAPEREQAQEPAGPREFWMGQGWTDAEDEPKPDGRERRRLRRIGRRREEPDLRTEPTLNVEPQDLGARIEPFFDSLRSAPPCQEPAAQESSDDIWAAHYRAHQVSEPPPQVRAAPFLAPKSTATPAPQTNPKGSFTLPPTSLLTQASGAQVQHALSDEELTERAEQLEGTLRDFGVKGEITEVHPGPVITLYELRPARGTKSSRVIGLSDDIARSMGAVSARVSVIPGRDALGIELPNEKRETVYLRALLETAEFRNSQAKLALALGKSIGGTPVIVDLARMPHLLVAGTTGSGKSVGINAMILSLIYRLPPDQCKFIMIDPKMLELSVYNGIPHLLTPVVTDPKKAVAALKWTVAEMNRRYERMHKVGVRNIQGYNQRVAEARARGDVLGRTVNTGYDEATGQPIYEHEDIDAEPMPYIVVVIDEMADLMMVAGKDIEFAVQRLSQMARAAGIHVIMATQRPSVDVITGTIKANFPSRISFQVTSKVDSRTILGEQGSEQLLGAGDMLHLAPGGRLTRVHGPFVADQELEKVVHHLKQQGAPEYRTDVLEAQDDPVDPRLSNDSKPSGDDLLDEAIEIVRRDRRATTSYLQRRLGIGYNRAASLIERLEDEGIIGPAGRGGKREILIGEAEDA